MNIEFTNVRRQNFPINQKTMFNILDGLTFAYNHLGFIALSHLPYNWLIDLDRHIRIVALERDIVPL